MIKWLVLLLFSLGNQSGKAQASEKLLDLTFYPLSLVNLNQSNIEFGLSAYPLTWLELNASLGVGFVENNDFGFRNFYKVRSQVVYRLPFIQSKTKVVGVGVEYTLSNGEAKRQHTYLEINEVSHVFDEADHHRQVTTWSGIANFTFDWPKFALTFTLGAGVRKTHQSLSNFVDLREKEEPTHHGPIFSFADRNLSDTDYSEGHFVAQISLRLPIIKRKSQE